VVVYNAQLVMPKKLPTQARKEFSDTYSVSTVIIETNPIEKYSDTTEMDERMHSMIQNEQEQQKPFLDLAKINSKPPEKELMELENRIRTFLGIFEFVIFDSRLVHCGTVSC
jgi:hypothetical protein